MKYIVFWIVTNMVSVPCPESKQENPYGIKQQFQTIRSMACMNRERERKYKFFNNDSNAHVFVKELKTQGYYINIWDPDTIKSEFRSPIDSIRIYKLYND